MSQRIIDQNLQGQEILKEYLDTVDMLSGMTVEMFDEHKTTLLSPIFRQMILDKGKKLRELHLQYKDYLCIDWIERKTPIN